MDEPKEKETHMEKERVNNDEETRKEGNEITENEEEDSNINLRTLSRGTKNIHCLCFGEK